ncbi:MAG TPA: hypothetical protein VD699_04315 [Nitrosopumilaceae archaeon]|nr:hypothetical protein [Nitrosopumilaceae archaeon]
MNKYQTSLLLFTLLFTSASAEPTPDYYNPYAPIATDKQVYSWTDKVEITIVAPSWNENKYGIDSIGDKQGYFIKVSTHGHDLEPYRLVETSPSSGVFTGEIILTGFLHDANGDGEIDTQPRTLGTGPTSGFLEADRDDGITISFEFADGVVLTHSAQIRWNEGRISLDKPSYLPHETANIQVIDPDMNLNPEASDTIPVEISSDSDVAGITVDAVETSENSGIFVANVSFTPYDRSSGNRLHAILDDRLYAKYVDHTLPSPFNINDDLDIITESVLSSNTSSADKVTLENVILTDSLGMTIQNPMLGQQLQVVAEIENKQDYDQPFVYLVQVKDSAGTVMSLSWFKGSITINQKLAVSQSWSPTESGTYTIETFVWKSLDNPVPLVESSKVVYKVTQ